MLLSPEDSWIESLSVRFDGRYARSGDRLDNRRENLRVTDRSTNARNCRPDIPNLSGYKGVSQAHYEFELANTAIEVHNEQEMGGETHEELPDSLERSLPHGRRGFRSLSEEEIRAVRR